MTGLVSCATAVSWVSGFSELRPINILAIDDEPENLTVIEQLLVRPNCNVVTVTSATVGLRQLLKIDFSLVLLDVSMPEMDGFEVATLIRQVKRLGQLPIIFLTANAEDADFRGDGTGNSYCIAKPVDPEKLRITVAAATACLRTKRRKTDTANTGAANDASETSIRQRATSLIAANALLRRDIVRRKDADEVLQEAMLELAAANLAKSAYLDNMSHEIRTPISGIVGMMELALQTKLTAEQREYLGLAKTSAGALLDVINDVLDFSKIETGHLAVEAIPYSLRECLGDTMKAMAFDAHRKSLELAFEIAPDVPDALLGDPLRLRQVIINLVSNAIKFTARGEVVLQVVRDGQAVRGDAGVDLRFAVSDSGIGLPADKLETIFTPFTQADASTTRYHGGTGLGLTIAARLVQALGGAITVESAPGQGSTFRFTLHLPTQGALQEAAVDADFSGWRALVVDDHPVSRRSVANTLRQWNIDVHEATDGKGAIQAILQSNRTGRPYDLVVLDDTLPDVNGHVVARQIIRHADYAVGILIVLGSLLKRDDIDNDNTNGGEGEYFAVTKPIKASELLAAIGAKQRVAVAPGRSLPMAQAHPGTTVLPLDILLVEDNPINSRLARQVLTSAGYRVTVADNGMAALAALDCGHFDLALMDMQMPGMDGIETTGLIRKKEGRSGTHLPILALTAHALPSQRQRCLAAGMDGYLVKPIRPADLLQAIERGGLDQPRQPEFRPNALAILDKNALLERVDGDAELLEEITAMFLDKGAQLMARARDAMAKHDENNFGYAIHTMTGMFRSLSANAALAVATRLETFVMAANRLQMQECFALLEQEVTVLRVELVNLSNEESAGNPGIACCY
jgi:CheY-like chemotaxis protein/HPt (histidine-containing phosphotransfer) domain-containing protein